MNIIRQIKVLSLLLALLPISLIGYSGITNFSIKNFSKELYGAQNQNWSVAINNEGIKYFANNEGLLEFDGYKWSFYPTPGGTTMRAVACSKDGRIYTSGYRELGYWLKDQYGFLHYKSLDSLAKPFPTKNEEFWSIIISNKRIYFHSFNALYVLQDSLFSKIDPPGFISSVAIINGYLNLNIKDKGIYRINDNNVPEPFLNGEFFSGKQIRTLIQGDEGSFLIVTASNGIFKYDGNQVLPVFENLTTYFKDKQINRAKRFGKNYIIGTILDGIIVIDSMGKSLFKLNQASGLQDNTILDISTDRYDNIWLALDRGISFVNINSDPAFQIHNNLEIGAIYSAAMFNGRLYMGTNQGLYYSKNPFSNDHFTFVPGTQGQVWNCKVIGDNLIVNHNDGTFLVSGDRVKKISNVSGGMSFTECEQKPGIWFQSTYSNIVRFDFGKGGINMVGSVSNFNDLIRFLEMDHFNNLWAGHMYKSIYKLKLNERLDSIVKIKYYGKNSVFKKDYNVHPFKIEGRVVFTTGDSLFTYDDLKDTIVGFQWLNRALGVFKTTHRIITAPNHSYWFFTNESVGLFRIFDKKVVRVMEYPYELFKYQLVENYENILPLNSGQALLCMENGYALLNIHTDSNKNKINTMDIKIRKISVSGRAGKEKFINIHQKDLTLKYTKTNLKLQYSFIIYGDDDIRFQYYIEGLTNTWSEPSREPVFTIDRLPAGEFNVNVRAVNNWMEKSRINTLHIKVLPPKYRSDTSFFLYFVFIIGLFIFFRYRAISRIKRIENSKVEQKEREIIQLRNQTLRNELSYRSSELANSTMAIIKKNEFLLEMKDMLKEQKTQLGVRYPDKFYHKMTGKIDRNLSGGGDWKIFETHLNKAHEAFNNKLLMNYPDLSYSDIRLCMYLRMNLSTKEIAPLLHISVRGVENHRYRLRKKLGLKKDNNLTDFILSIKV